MLRTFTAREFLQPAARGSNLPIVVSGYDADGEETNLFLKTRTGYGDRRQAAGVELLTTLLAREIGVSAPEPVLIDVPQEFHTQVYEHPKHQSLLSSSIGLNFGTVSLGPDWKTWPVGMSVRAFSPDVIEKILVFDALVQQTDRTSDNPNIMWRGRELAVLDHEKCFGYLPLVQDKRRPWVEFFARYGMQTHCLLHAGPTLVNHSFGKGVWEVLLGLEFSGRLGEFVTTAKDAFPEAAMELDQIYEYFEAVFRDIQGFLEYLKHVLSR